MPTLRFEGYSDDTFGEYAHTNNDYDNCASGESIEFLVEDTLKLCLDCDWTTLPWQLFWLVDWCFKWKYKYAISELADEISTTRQAFLGS
jgi:hypothetical protein